MSIDDCSRECETSSLSSWEMKAKLKRAAKNLEEFEIPICKRRILEVEGENNVAAESTDHRNSAEAGFITEEEGRNVVISNSISPQHKTSEIAGKEAWSDYESVFTNAKAGMDGVDKEKVKRVVYEMSKGSRYFVNEERKEAAVQERLAKLRSHAGTLTPQTLALMQKAADRQIAHLEATRDLSRIWMHVDMDAFYAAVEELENPSLIGKPVGVGGMGMLCTANYEARKYGVRAAMPGFIGRKLCPSLILVKPNFERYSHYCELSRKIFQEYDPHFIARSLDEAYIDLTATCRLRGATGAEIAEEIRQMVWKKTHLTCSAGVAPNRLLAKVASDLNKPNGQFVVPSNRSAIMAFITTLPIRKVTGIGKVTEKLLREVAGVTLCGQLLEKRALLTALFSQVSTDFFLAVGLGIGGSEEPQEGTRKSMSCERTFSAMSAVPDLVAKMDELAESLAEDLARHNLQGRTLTLKLKTTNFEVRTRAVSLPNFIAKKCEMVGPALKLLQAELPMSIRLMGLRISNFRNEHSPALEPKQRTLSSFITPLPKHSPGGGQQPAPSMLSSKHLTSGEGEWTPGESLPPSSPCSPSKGEGMKIEWQRGYSDDLPLQFEWKAGSWVQEAADERRDSHRTCILSPAPGASADANDLLERPTHCKATTKLPDDTRPVSSLGLHAHVAGSGVMGQADPPSQHPGGTVKLVDAVPGEVELEWACQACTFLNPYDITRCQMCERPAHLGQNYLREGQGCHVAVGRPGCTSRVQQARLEKFLSFEKR